MEKATIKEIGTININAVEVAEGAIEMRIPIEAISNQMNITLDKVFTNYCKRNPQVKTEKVHYETRLIFQFGRSNPEFSLMTIVFDEDNEGIDEIWDELEITLSDEVKKLFRKVAWDKLGEVLFNL